MIFGVGVDMVSLSRVEKLWQNYGLKFADKILHPHEREKISASPLPGRYLAKGFAAREALVKALGTGLSQGIVMRDIELVRDPLGRPEFRLHGVCADFIKRNQIGKTHLSITDEGDLITAFVVVENRADPD